MKVSVPDWYVAGRMCRNEKTFGVQTIAAVGQTANYGKQLICTVGTAADRENVVCQ
jgi:hypothetical protein